MQDVSGKMLGGELPAAEWNQLLSELQNVIEGLGITLSASDLEQLGKSVVGYACASSYFVDGGSADTVQLSSVSPIQSPSVHTEGRELRFRPAEDNTGATTIQPPGLATKSLVRPDGTALQSGDLVTTSDARARYDSSNDRYLLDLSDDAIHANGAKLVKTTGQTIPSNSSSIVSWDDDGLQYDDLGWWDPSSPQVLTVPSDVSRVESTLYWFTGFGILPGELPPFPDRSAGRIARLLLNGVAFDGDLVSSDWIAPTTVGSTTIRFSGVIEVSEGDVLSVEVEDVWTLNPRPSYTFGNASWSVRVVG